MHSNAYRMFGLAFAALALLSVASSIMNNPRFTAAPATSAASQTTEPAALTGRLQAHVRRLAGEIGERNVFHPQALRAAADYFRAQWASQGYRVVPQSYEAYSVRSENLEVTLPGASRPGEIIVIGARYDSASRSPGANDNASGVAALLELSCIAWSDHLSFWREGYPALMVTDTAFYRYAHYHSHRDTPDQLNYPAMARAVMVLQAALTAMASRRGRSQ